MASEQGPEDTEDFNFTVDRGDGEGRGEEIGLICFVQNGSLFLREPLL